DLPGENKSGFGTAGGVSELPLETCQQIVNGSWGYHVNKMNCKSPVELINTLVATAGKGANLLLNIGPRPNGSIPGPAAESLRGLGKWISKYGETIYETDKGDISGAWGSSTRKGDRLFLHITHRPGDELYLPLGCKVKSAKMFIGGAPVKFNQWKHGIQLQLPEATDGEPVMVIELVTAGKIVL
ncbi:MAG: alpha-L-fucosidase, partial [Muribaculaceae bacterium]|nr:alpha-L-fucosidase [Muribaculaceae bacterium]